MVGPPPPTWSVDPGKTAVFELRPGLWTIRLPLPWPEISHVNAYLVAGAGGGATLMDCGLAGDPSNWEALVAGLAQTGYGVSDIEHLVVTHAHADHVGQAARLVVESRCTMWMHPDHSSFSDATGDGDRIYAARERRALQEGVPPESIDRYASVSEEQDGVAGPIPSFRALRGGMRLPSRLGEWQVIGTPGHSPSHVCLYQSDERLLVLGDLVSRVYAPWFDYGYSEDPVAEFAASLRAVGELDVALALPGHGRPIEDLDDVIRMHLSEIERRVAAVEAAVATSCVGAYALTRAVFGTPRSPYEEVPQFIETIAYLRHLRLAGRVTRELDEAGRFRYRPAAAAAPG